MRLSLTAATLIVAFHCPVSAQSWRELYERRDFAGAAAVLHPLVLDPALSAGRMADIDATEALARMYWTGAGVFQDRIVGCSLVQLALANAGFGVWEQGDSRYLKVEQLKASTCDTLSEDDRAEAMQMLGCPRYGFERHVYPLDGNRSVEVSPRRIRIDNGSRQISRRYQHRVSSAWCWSVTGG